MLAGVTIERPETVCHRCAGADRYGHGDRAVHAPAGQPHIGEDCRIGAGAILEYTELADAW